MASGATILGHYCHHCQLTSVNLLEPGTCTRCLGNTAEQDAPGLDEEAEVALADSRRRRRLMQVMQRLSDVMETLRQVYASRQNQPRPASKASMDAIRLLEFDECEVQRCVICCTDFETGEMLGQLPGCNHLFHNKCVRQWMSQAGTCPVCRNRPDDHIVQEEPEEEESSQATGSDTGSASSSSEVHQEPVQVAPVEAHPERHPERHPAACADEGDVASNADNSKRRRLTRKTRTDQSKPPGPVSARAAATPASFTPG
eukprot:TRINITY_DN10040_c0_g1_i1.p1 TRINITY_DN10040_c0_g1~~TRINITY_DN10040_c0_g1_i1.p1  ORF type:complete len:258 (+),score=41.50 TRINITY_DN10040_c0_g1_i1:58-831(+)